MNKARLEAFSDGVIAVIITIMVLDMKVPHGSDFDALLPVLPVFTCYVLSYVMVGIYLLISFVEKRYIEYHCKNGQLARGNVVALSNMHFCTWERRTVPRRSIETVPCL
jgi:hypothetical protein